MLSLLQDIKSGALPAKEIPAYLAHVVSSHIGFTCAAVAVVGTIVFVVMQ